MSKTLWTGYTARQELRLRITNVASLRGWTVCEALEEALDGAERAEAGSIKADMLAYWNGLSDLGQTRLLAECRKIVRANDRLEGGVPAFINR